MRTIGPRLVLTWLLASALSGCVSTLFESPPGEFTAGCDSRWIGTWNVEIAQKPHNNDTLTLQVGADCKTVGVTENGKPQHDLDGAVLAFAIAQEPNIVGIRLDPRASGAHTKPAQWDTGYHYFSYRAGAAEIRLHPIDDERVAQLLVQGKLFGRTEKVTRYPGAHQASDAATLHNFVAGTPSDMAQALAAYPLFSDLDTITFKRIAADRK